MCRRALSGRRADDRDQTAKSGRRHCRQWHCGPFDPKCRDHLQTILSAIHVLPVNVEGGVTFGGAGANGAVKFSTKVLGVDYESGDLSALIFDAMYLPAEGGFRVRFTLADTEVLFMCKNAQGDVIAPIQTLLEDCTPGGAFAYVGAGAKLAQIQWDTATQRIAARWGEINAVLNLLGNANDESYLKAHLQAYMGASLDTIWYGNTPGTSGGSATMPRGNFGITGMIRSDDNHWEVRGMAGIRPNLASIQDYSVEARGEALYHLLLSPTTMMNIGLDGQYQYNSVPANSMGDFVSDRDRNSAYLGAVLGFVFQ